MVAPTYLALQRSYAEPHRRHHVWYHIEKGIELIYEFRDAVAHLEWLTLAYFNHDRVYDTRRQDNELVSANRTSDDLRQANALPEAILGIHSLIMDTAHSLGRTLTTVDSQLIVSADLVTLGFAPELFDRYSRNIFVEFVEYGGVDSREFLKEQNEFFKSMLVKPVIYPFAPLHQRYDAQARENLTRAIRAYEAKTAAN
jgi:predicted metal-dependent HD superfamily phosphohydrolase